jgi:hypothetical protein
MSVPVKPADPQSTGDTLRSYLLGTLPEERQREVEERIFLDDAFFDAAEFAEDCLIDEYLSGAMDGEDQQRFSRHYLNSPSRRRHLQLAASLRGLFGTQEQTIPLRAPARWSAGPPRWAAMAMAAGLVLTAGLAIAAALRSGRLARVAEERARTAEAQAADSRLKLDQARAASKSNSGSIAFVLPPGVFRGDENLTIPISPDASTVRLALERDTVLVPGEYQLTIVDSARRVVWTVAIRREGPPAYATIIADVPANLLRPGSYVATLTRVGAGRRKAMPDDYAFRIEKR